MLEILRSQGPDYGYCETRWKKANIFGTNKKVRIVIDPEGDVALYVAKKTIFDSILNKLTNIIRAFLGGGEDDPINFNSKPKIIAHIDLQKVKNDKTEMIKLSLDKLETITRSIKNINDI